MRISLFSRYITRIFIGLGFIDVCSFFFVCVSWISQFLFLFLYYYSTTTTIMISHKERKKIMKRIFEYQIIFREDRPKYMTKQSPWSICISLLFKKKTNKRKKEFEIMKKKIYCVQIIQTIYIKEQWKRSDCSVWRRRPLLKNCIVEVH